MRTRHGTVAPGAPNEILLLRHDRQLRAEIAQVPERHIIDRSRTVLVEEFEYNQALIPSALASLGGVVRLGSSFSVELRVYYERQLRSW